ncbi:Hsp20/alpha crystallin family protein [Candidatus Latescibacterota bacterium]
MLTRTLFPMAFRSGYPNWAPYRELRGVHNELGRPADPARDPRCTEYPPLNVWCNEDETIVQAELPGLAADDIDISVVQNTLTLRGSRNPEGLKEGESYHRRERWTGRFVRSLELPFEVDNSKVEAEYKHGMLTIRLPRAEEHKPKKITVKAS